MIGRQAGRGGERKRAPERGGCREGKNRQRRGAWRRWQTFLRCKYLCPP